MGEVVWFDGRRPSSARPWIQAPLRPGRVLVSHLQAAGGRGAHSHMVTMFQPWLRSASLLRRSRARFPSILCFHHARRDFGRRKWGQCSWPCQKQPCTKMTVWCFGRTRSGLPGSDWFFGPLTVEHTSSLYELRRTSRAQG
jgi:hypothetical protein